MCSANGPVVGHVDQVAFNETKNNLAKLGKAIIIID